MKGKNMPFKKALLKRGVPIAAAALLMAQGTGVTALAGTLHAGLPYRITRSSVVAEVKTITLENNKDVKIEADGYTVSGAAKVSHVGAYILTTNGVAVTDAKIEVVGEADITLKDCHLTTATALSPGDKGLFYFSGGKVELKLENKNSFAFTGTDDTYTLGSMGSNEDLTVSGNGSLYLQNAGLQAAGSKLKLDGSKVYSSGTVTAKDFEAVGAGTILAAKKLITSTTTVLNGDVAVYAKQLNAHGYQCDKGIIYNGTAVAVTSGAAATHTLTGGIGTVYGDPDLAAGTFENPGKLGTSLEDIEISIPSTEYTGAEIAIPNFNIQVTKKALTKTLVKGTDFKAEWKSGQNKTNAGTKTVEVSAIAGTGNIGSGIEKTFEVTKKNISGAEVEVDLADLAYTGIEQSKAVTVKVGAKTLTATTDYILVNDKGTKAGEYGLKVTGAGNYEGETPVKTWKIIKAPLTITAATIAEKTYDGNTNAAVTGVTFGGLVNSETLTRGADYEVTAAFADSKAGTNKNVTVTVTMKDTETANNYNLATATFTLTGQEIKRGKHNAPASVTGRYAVSGTDRTKFAYAVDKIDGAEYSKDDVNWQESNVFDGIAPSSNVTFYARIKSTESMDASDSANTGSVTFNKLNNISKPALQVKVEGEANARTVTITKVDGAEYSFDDGGSYESGADKNKKAGIDSTASGNDKVKVAIRFKETETLNASAAVKEEVDLTKTTPNAPAPVVSGKYELDEGHPNKFKYTVEAPVGAEYEYSKDLEAYQSGNIFDNIDPESIHTFYVRTKATATKGAGLAGSKEVTFELFDTPAPKLEAEVTGDAGNRTITIAEVNGAQYKFGSDSWGAVRVKNNVSEEIVKVGIRIPKNATHKASVEVFKDIRANGSAGGGAGSLAPLPAEEKKDDGNKPEENKNNGNTNTAKPDKAPVNIKVTAEGSKKGKAEAFVSAESIKTALEAAKPLSDNETVKLDVTVPDGVNNLKVHIEKSALGNLVTSAIKAFEITAANVKLEFEGKALASMDNQSGGNVTLSIASARKLTSKMKKVAGNRPVYTVSAASEGTKISNLGGGKVKVSIRYVKSPKEKAGGLYAVYFNKKGKAVRIKGSVYDEETGMLTFSTKYLTKYAIGYKAPKKSK